MLGLKLDKHGIVHTLGLLRLQCSPQISPSSCLKYSAPSYSKYILLLGLMMASLTCAGLLVIVELKASAAVTGEGSRGGDTDLLTVMLLLSTRVYHWVIQTETLIIA